MNYELLSRLDLRHGDTVVSMVTHKDYIVVVTAQGSLYRLSEKRL